MLRVRSVKTSSGSTAIQVVEYHQGGRKILHHVGSANNEEELLALKQKAADWIKNNDKQLSFLDNLCYGASEDKKETSGEVNDWSNYRSSSVKYSTLYRSLREIMDAFGFSKAGASLDVDCELLSDLVIARIVSPGSKLHSLNFLQKAFGIKHSYRSLSRSLPKFIDLKDNVEGLAINAAKSYFSFNFNLVFYDLTTLYFESFETDGLRKIGFSKDNKSSNPQIMIGLLVNDIGFPISYQLFPGNKFEGHTLLPSITSLRRKYKIKEMTVVADSAMISDDNIKFLTQENLNYIVAARTANLPLPIIEKIAEDLNKKDEATLRISTASKGDLILCFSKKRYDKEKRGYSMRG